MTSSWTRWRGDRLSPLLVNTRRWNIATLRSPAHIPLPRPLKTHIENLFQTLLPERSDRPYDIRIACQYAFALVFGDPGLEDDLLSSLPVFLSPRFAIPSSLGTANAGTSMSERTAQLQTNIVDELLDWYEEKKPLSTKGRYVFSISIFAAQPGDPDASTTDNPNLPLLKVEHLSLALTDIADHPGFGIDIAALFTSHGPAAQATAATPRTLAAHLKNLLAHVRTRPDWASLLAPHPNPSHVFHLIVQFITPEATPSAHVIAYHIQPLTQPLDDEALLPVRSQLLTHQREVLQESGYYVFTLSIVPNGRPNASEQPPEPLVVTHYSLTPSRISDLSTI